MAWKKNRGEYIYTQLDSLFPDAKCELNYHNHFELLCAVVLSAQTTDISVNKVTPALFEKFPDALAMSNAQIEDVKKLIHSIGLYQMKAAHLIAMSKQLTERFNGNVPATMEELTSLSGVGRKTANVVMSELFEIDTIAVDTHVARVSKRLKIASEADSVEVVEEKLKKYFPKETWRRLHHLFIFFGRYKCFARNPDCLDCPFSSFCRK